eukprot:4186317-Amphidinium_carterae.1
MPQLEAKDFVESLVETMLRAPQKQGLPVENRKELVRQSLHVLQELGMRSLVRLPSKQIFAAFGAATLFPHMFLLHPCKDVE